MTCSRSAIFRQPSRGLHSHGVASSHRRCRSSMITIAAPRHGLVPLPAGNRPNSAMPRRGTTGRTSLRIRRRCRLGSLHVRDYAGGDHLDAIPRCFVTIPPNVDEGDFQLARAFPFQFIENGSHQFKRDALVRTEILESRKRGHFTRFRVGGLQVAGSDSEPEHRERIVEQFDSIS